MNLTSLVGVVLAATSIATGCNGGVAASSTGIRGGTGGGETTGRGEGASSAWPVGFPANGVITDLVTTSDDGVVIVGGLYSPTAVGAGPFTCTGGECIFVLKLDAAGNHVFGRVFGDLAGDNFARSIARDAADNLYISGKIQGAVDFGGGPLDPQGAGDAFLVKLDRSGNHVWSKRFGGPWVPTDGAAVAANAAGDVVLAGSFEESIDFGSGPLTAKGPVDGFVAVFDTEGAPLFSRPISGSELTMAQGVAIDASRNVVVTGYFRDTVDLASPALVSAGGNDAFIARLDSTGATTWSKRFGGPDNDAGEHVAFDAAGDVILAGDLGSTADFGGGPLTATGDQGMFFAKLDAAGNHLWSRVVGGAGATRALGMATSPSGDIGVACSFDGGFPFAGTMVIGGALGGQACYLRFDSAGEQVAGLAFISNTRPTSASAVGIAPDGDARVAGSFEENITILGEPLSTAEFHNMFVVRVTAP